jgi:hypothetical protein
MPDTELELAQFVRGEMDPAKFPHRDHVRLGFEMLRRRSFVETALHYSQGLQRMTARIGKPEAFHQTITIAFLSLIAERMQSGSYEDFEAFMRANGDLVDKAMLGRWYSSGRLGLDAARRTFVLPDPVR